MFGDNIHFVGETTSVHIIRKVELQVLRSVKTEIGVGYCLLS